MDDFIRLARCTRAHGVAAGVCVAPATPVAEIEPLLSATWKPGEDGSALGELSAEKGRIDERLRHEVSARGSQSAEADAQVISR